MTQPSTPGALGTNRDMSPMLLGVFKQAQRTVQDAFDTLTRSIDTAFNAVNNLLQRFHDWLKHASLWSRATEWFTDTIADAISAIQKIFEGMREGIDKILQIVKEAIGGAIPVISLFEVASDWSSNVLTPLSNLTNEFVPNSDTLTSWRGEAHDAYMQKMSDQKDAVSALSDKVKATSSWLADVGQGNINFMKDLADTILEVAGDLTKTGTDIAQTSVGNVPAEIPASQHASESVGDTVTTMVKIGGVLAARLGEVLKTLNDLANDYDNLEGLTNGQWPAVVEAG